MSTNIKPGHEILDALNWRYATKKFDPSKKIPSDVWRSLEDALRLSPSSYGLQPYKFVVVTDQKLKEELVAASWNQKQPADCSHLVVFARLANLDENYIQHYMERISEVRGVSKDSLEAMSNMILGSIKSKTKEEIGAWAAAQCYIALGNLMAAASLMHVDNCPMEGFIKEDYDRILKLNERGLHSVVMCALGYRASDDKYEKLAKVRMPENELFVNI